jgi:hypothetical protein
MGGYLLPHGAGRFLGNVPEDGDAPIRADDSAQRTAGTVVVRVYQNGRVIPFFIQFVGKFNHVLGTGFPANLTSFTSFQVNNDSSCGHSNAPLEL